MASLFMTPADEQRFVLVTLQLLTRATSPQPSVYLVHPGPPVPKGRPRFTRKGIAYTPAKTAAAETDLAWALKSKIRHRPMEGPVAIVAVFYVADQRRSDVDNFMKLVYDAGNKAGIWHDDSQVTACAAIVDLDKARPRTIIALAPAMSKLTRMPSKKQREKR